MSNLRSRLRSELPNLIETRRILSKIKKLLALSSQHVSFEVNKRFRINGKQLTAIVVEPTGTTGNVQFRRHPFTAVKARLQLQDLTFVADTAGTAGNGITIAYTTGGTAGSEVVSVVSLAISVQIQSGVSTATQIKAAIDAAAPAAALVDTSISGTGATAQTAPVTATNLAGGLAQASLETYDLADIQMIKRLRTKKYLIKIKNSANPA